MNSIVRQSTTSRFTAINGDCVMAMSDLPDASIGFSIYSPPFGDLFCYSDFAEDMSNAAGDEEFFAQYRSCVEQVYRLTKPGRLSAVHCTDLPTKKWRDGYLALNNFSEKVSALHQELGWYLHSRITIWKSPVSEMQRTKALGLLYKQLRKDSSISRVGMPDYVLMFRKPGDNDDPITHDEHDIPLDTWQQWASPVWMDIAQGNVLNVRMAKDNADEKHLCPLQLDLIERAIRMWSNPDDIVLSPFMGIGSEGYVALRFGRKFIGTELKPSYYVQACKYLAEAEANPATGNLLAAIGA